jgi:predicted PurR-regulated permease PerM
VESNLVSPVIVGRRLSLSALSVFLSVLFWGWLWGIVGALIAVPLLIILRSLSRRRRSLRLLRFYLEGDHCAPPPSMRSLLRAPPRPKPRSRYT